MSVSTDIQVISVPCGEPDCDYVETGPATGRGSAPFKIGSHRWNVHGLKKDGTRREDSKGTGKKDADPEPTGVRAALSVVGDVADEVRGEGVPTRRQLEKAGSKLLQVGTAAFASVMAETEDGLSEGERDEIEDLLTLTSSQANELVSPFARVAAPSNLNKRFGRKAVDVAEVAAPVAEATVYAITVARYFRDRRRRREVQTSPGTYYQGPQQPPQGVADPHNPGGTAVPAEVVLTGGAPTGGMVIDPSTAEGRRLLEEARRG